MMFTSLFPYLPLHSTISSMEATTIQILDKQFSHFITEDQIEEAVKELAFRINQDYAGKDLVIVPVLNGAFMFAADLIKRLNFACEITFIKIASYQGVSSTGEVEEVLGLEKDIMGRHVLIVEDIVDTGVTMHEVTKSLKELGPASLEIATFLQKPDALSRNLKLKYVGMKIPNKFVVGYGLDYDGYGRNLREIYVLTEQAEA
jgi:hypoxanthine phosphoribosyltransferase